jgi:hypothetical protein
MRIRNLLQRVDVEIVLIRRLKRAYQNYDGVGFPDEYYKILDDYTSAQHKLQERT